MIIRALYPRDFDQVKRIHEKFYKNEFDISEFRSKFLGSFVVLDDNEKVICAGGVRTLAEIILVTDKDISAKVRRKALYETLQVSSCICNRSGYSQLHAFVQDESWLRHLTKAGFVTTKGRSLVIGV